MTEEVEKENEVTRLFDCEHPDVCAFCGLSANQRCTGCQVAFYCSREHQKLHWKIHKNLCCPYRICHSELLGRYMVATRDLKPGELILKEAPITMGPMAVTVPCCLSCFAPVDGKIRCLKCGWPMCCLGCKSLLHEAECYLSVQGRGQAIKFDVGNPKKPCPLYEVVTIMRCLYLKLKQPDKYRSLMSLEAHTKKRKLSGRYERDCETMLRVLHEYFKLNQADTFSDEEILDVCGILYVNSHEIPITDSCPVQAIYKKVSLIEHCCLNNASKHFDMNYAISVRAAVPINKGENISIMYSDPMWGTASRQAHLLETKFFRCHCQRCTDPTELGTMFSSLRCPFCPLSSELNAYLVASSGISANWRCIECHQEQKQSYVDAVIRSIGEELVSMPKGNIDACQAFVTKHSQNLHPHHYYLMDIKLALTQMIQLASYGESSNQALLQLSEEELELKQQLCKEVLEVANVISPGISRLRGIILYELQSTICARARKKFLNSEISMDHLRNIMKDVTKELRECIQIFSYEPVCIQEGKLAEVARLDLVLMEDTIEKLENKMSNFTLHSD